MQEDMYSEIIMPPLRYLDDTSFISPSLIRITNKILTTYPISLVKIDTKGFRVFLGFIFAYSYVTKDRIKILLSSSPKVLTNELDTEVVVKRLVNEVIELGESLNCEYVEFVSHVVHDPHYVRLPISLDPFGTFSNSFVERIVVEMGFNQTRKEEEIRIPLRSDIVPKPLDIIVDGPILISDETDRLLWYHRLCSIDKNYSALLPEINKSQINITDGDRRYKKENHLLFYKIHGQEYSSVVYWNPVSIYQSNYPKNEAKILRTLFRDEIDKKLISKILHSSFVFLRNEGYEYVYLTTSKSICSLLPLHDGIIKVKTVRSFQKKL